MITPNSNRRGLNYVQIDYDTIKLELKIKPSIEQEIFFSMEWFYCERNEKELTIDKNSLSVA